MARNEQPDTAAQEWEPCAPGEVRKLGMKLRGRQTRRVFLRNSLATIGTIVAAGGGALARVGRRDDFGGISCSEVARLQPGYMNGTLPEPTRSRIAEHLAKCPECGPHFRQMPERKHHNG